METDAEMEASHAQAHVQESVPSGYFRHGIRCPGVTSSVPGSFTSCTAWALPSEGTALQGPEGQRAARESREGEPRLREKRNSTVSEKRFSVYLTSQKYHFKGEVDEVSFSGGWNCCTFGLPSMRSSRRPFTRRTSFRPPFTGCSLWSTSCGCEAGLCLLHQEQHHVEEIDFQQKNYEKALQIVHEILMIIQRGYYPEGTKQKARCVDCTYRNICV